MYLGLCYKTNIDIKTCEIDWCMLITEDIEINAISVSSGNFRLLPALKKWQLDYFLYFVCKLKFVEKNRKRKHISKEICSRTRYHKSSSLILFSFPGNIDIYIYIYIYICVCISVCVCVRARVSMNAKK